MIALSSMVKDKDLRFAMRAVGLFFTALIAAYHLL